MPKKSHFLNSIVLKRELVDSFNDYPFHLPVIRKLEKLSFHPKVTYFVGENGMGKSTLLEAIAVQAGFNPEGGTSNYRFSTFNSHSKLDEYITLVKGFKRPHTGFFLRAETFYNLATYVEKVDSEPSYGGRIIDTFGGRSLHEQSHGEAFWSLFMHRFQGNGLYILDEPESALSPIRQISMLARIDELTGKNAQFIIATHSPIVMAYPDSIIYEFSEDGAKRVVLEQTGHYQFMKQFFEDKDRLLYHLFKASGTMGGD